MEGEVCLLDSRPAPGRQGDSKRQMGSRRRGLGTEQMGSNAETGSIPESSQGVDPCLSLFFYDSRPEGWTPVGTYIRDSELVLGDDRELDIRPTSPYNKSGGCFNCGSPHHHVGSCPLPRDHLRISLARQYHNFFKDENSCRSERFLDAAEWQRQKLEWVDKFEPGTIKSELLKTALGDQNIYLRNIAILGYPKGWFSIRDPRELMKERILNNGFYDPTATEPFFIFGDKVEPLPCSAPAMDGQKQSESVNAPKPVAKFKPTRWARYPSIYFETDTLPVYVPPKSLEVLKATTLLRFGECTSTFTPERRRLWEMIVSGVQLSKDDPSSSIPSSAIAELPPLFPKAAYLNSLRAESNLPVPPPPAESPPPLPLSSSRLKPEQLPELASNYYLSARVPRSLLPSVSPYGLLFLDSPDICPPHFGTYPSEPIIILLSSDVTASETSDMEISDSD
ncbi:hypothetical protein AX15_006025 [Amanita polypyramis BW_CC]|nr:hypothetical protein AX15_006025 [Amanita polypyramis BW_CC]